MASVATPLPQPAALSEHIAANPHNKHYHALALQVQYNLQYQHNWKNLHYHSHSPISKRLLPRPLISGLPPTLIYVHPDEQIEILQEVKNESIAVEREWVLPTHLKEKWNLRRFAEVFDAVGEVPPSVELDDGQTKRDEEVEAVDETTGKRRGGKRVLLATVGHDSTIVYYIVHDGLVKPRQN